MIDDALKIGSKLMPPGVDALTWWRILVGASVSGLILFALWAVGFFGGGFAEAGDLTEFRAEAKLDRILVRRRDQCQAEMGSEARVFYASRVATLAAEYEQLTGKRPHIPDCDQL